MGYIDKFKGNIAGYMAIVLWIVILTLGVFSTTMDIHFKCDIFVTILLSGLLESCRETYIDYRKIEIEEMNNQ